MSQANSMRKRHRFNTRMTRIVLLISFLFFFGRFVYSSISAWQHHQDKKKRNSHRFLSPHRDNVKLLSVKKPAQEKEALALTQKDNPTQWVQAMIRRLKSNRGISSLGDKITCAVTKIPSTEYKIR